MKNYMTRRYNLSFASFLHVTSFLDFKGVSVNKLESNLLGNIISTLILNESPIVRISLRNGFYKKNRYYQDSHSAKTIRSLIKKLFDAHLISFSKGYQTKSGVLCSRITFHKDFYDYLLQKIKKEELIFVESRETIILKDEKKKIINYSEREKTRLSRRILKSFDEMMSNRITYDGNNIFMKSTRIFNDGSFLKGGRIYNSFQNIEKSKRDSLKIDGEDLVEIDFKCFHLAILYGIKGLEMKDSPYEGYKGFTREECKKAVMICLNSKSERMARNSIENNLGKTKKEARYFIANFKYSHQNISESLFSNSGLKVHYKESLVMMDIIRKCAKVNIPIIPKHDGALCKRSDIVRLMRIFSVSCQKTLKFKAEVSVKI